MTTQHKTSQVNRTQVKPQPKPQTPSQAKPAAQSGHMVQQAKREFNARPVQGQQKSRGDFDPLNEIKVVGNAGSDGELRYTPGGRSVGNFRLAVSRKYQSNGEIVHETEWFTVVMWGELADKMATQVSKGSRVRVEGRFQSREFARQDGQMAHRNEIVANAVYVQTGNTKPATQNDEDELPF